MFKPNKIIVEEAALQYSKGQELLDRFTKEGKEIQILPKKGRIQVKAGTPKEKFEQAKNTLVVGVRKTLEFESCKPSAHYQIPLVTGCMGMCEYCYLNTRLANQSYVRVYVNIEEILQKAKQYIEQRKPEITIFEAAATSDPIPVEGYTHNLEKAIQMMASEEYGRLRFVTKYPFVDSLLSINHQEHTQIRFSMNTKYVIENYEHRTGSLEKRIEALGKVAKANYPVGIMIAPVFLYPNWKEEYQELMEKIKISLREKELEAIPIQFEIVTHRYTIAAKNKIQECYPNTTLPMQEEDRKFKYGQFGYGKYLYRPEEIKEIKQFFEEIVKEKFPNGKILYTV